MKSFSTVSVLALLCLALVSNVYSWGEEGHKIVAQIASDLLNSNAQNLVSEYEGESGESLPDMAPLPDAYDHTSEGRWSGPMHYCNLPRDATSFDMSYCPNLCVVKAIQNYTAILSKATPSACNFDQEDGVEPCPLEFLVHFVGDVHQPLHVSYGDDEGGNAVKVYWYGDETNLHEVWDVKIIDKWDGDYQDAASQLEAIMNNNPNLVQQFLANMDPIVWANESFGFVLTTVYNFSDSYSAESSKKYPDLGDVYYSRNEPIVQMRLIAAGVRLAQLFNTILGGDVRLAVTTLQQYLNRVNLLNSKYSSTPKKVLQANSNHLKKIALI